MIDIIRKDEGRNEGPDPERCRELLDAAVKGYRYLYGGHAMEVLKNLGFTDNELITVGHFKESAVRENNGKKERDAL